jgi:hypothetical protein
VFFGQTRHRTHSLSTKDLNRLIPETASTASLTDLWFTHFHTLTEGNLYFMNFLTPEQFPGITVAPSQATETKCPLSLKKSEAKN